MVVAAFMVAFLGHLGGLMYLPEELRIKLRESRPFRRFNRRRKWHQPCRSFLRFRGIKDGRYVLEECDPLCMPSVGYTVEERVWYRDVNGDTLPGYVSQRDFDRVWAD